MCELAGLYLK